jgi:hypothetical protein
MPSMSDEAPRAAAAAAALLLLPRPPLLATRCTYACTCDALLPLEAEETRGNAGAAAKMAEEAETPDDECTRDRERLLLGVPAPASAEWGDE